MRTRFGPDRTDADRARSRADAKLFYARHRDQVLLRRRLMHVVNPEQNRSYGRKRYALHQAFIDAARATGCVDCGNKNLTVLHSDHVRGTKSFNIGSAIGKRMSLKVILAELDKCETRCANCHAIVTANRRKKAA